MVNFNLHVNGDLRIIHKQALTLTLAADADPTVPPVEPPVEDTTPSPVTKEKVKGRLVVKATRTITGVKIELDWAGPFKDKKEDPWLTDREVSRQDSRAADQVRHKLSQVVTQALDSIKVGDLSLRDLVRKYTMRGLLTTEDYRVRQVTYQLRKELEKAMAGLPQAEVNAFKERYGTNIADILSDGTLSYRASVDSKPKRSWKRKSTIEVEIPVVSEVVNPEEISVASTKEEEMKQSLRNAYPGDEKVNSYIESMEKAHGVGFWNGFESIEDLKEDFGNF